MPEIRSSSDQSVICFAGEHTEAMQRDMGSGSRRTTTWSTGAQAATLAAALLVLLRQA
jgi:hypothetical protein